jgi:hypothetical protein
MRALATSLVAAVAAVAVVAVVVLLLLGAARVAAAGAPEPPPGIELSDLPGTDGNWQEGRAVIAAPRAAVHRWLTEYARWAERFTDIRWAEVLPDDERGRHVIRFSSRIADHVLTVHEAVSDELLVFEGWAPYLHTQGRIYLLDRGDGTTLVLMQSTAEAHGIARLFATKSLKRKRAYQVTTSHLQSLQTLARRLAAGESP